MKNENSRILTFVKSLKIRNSRKFKTRENLNTRKLPDLQYSNGTERANCDIYDDFKLNPSVSMAFTEIFQRYKGEVICHDFLSSLFNVSHLNKIAGNDFSRMHGIQRVSLPLTKHLLLSTGTSSAIFGSKSGYFCSQ